MLSSLVFADAHLHSSPKGLGALRIAKKFKERGGWFLALVMLPPWHYGIDISRRNIIEDYKRTISVFLNECKAARMAGVKVACLAGFHPAEVDKLVGLGFRPEEVLAIGEKVLEIEANLCREGVLDGIGEVGRQHYKSMPERFAIATSVMIKAFEYARDYGCLVHLHLENAGAVTVNTVDKLVALVGATKQKIVFHHASIRVAKTCVNGNYYATIPGKKELLRSLFSESSLSLQGLMIESDYIDDPKRPCVSSCPWEIIDNQLALLSEGIVDEDSLAILNIDNVSRYYGVEPP